jgi:HAD domain in Swiss Army Knife RNA repair proteins
MAKKEYSKQKVIFLDIDGVLATKKSINSEKHLWYSKRAYPFDKKCVTALNQVLEKINPTIVLTSDWRRAYDLEEINKIFKFNKVILSPSDYTKNRHNRDDEIVEYVIKNKLSKFVIIDDMLINCYRERFVRTNMEKGLQLDNVKRIVKLLK